MGRGLRVTRTAFVPDPLGATDVELAIPVEVPPGAGVSGIDFTLSLQEGVRVTGRVVDAVTGLAPDEVDIDLAYRDPGTGWDYGIDCLGRTDAFYENGIFEFRNVFPGVFTLTASIDEPTASDDGPDLKRAGYVPIVVGDSDIEDVVVTLSPGTTIFGRVFGAPRRRIVIGRSHPAGSLGCSVW